MAPRRVPAAAVAHDAQATAPHEDLTPIVQSIQTAIIAEPWLERAQSRKDERALRRQERQDNARSRRARAGMRADPWTTRERSPAAVTEKPVIAALRDDVAGPDELRARDRRTQRGAVKWFSEAKGYGFLKADDGTEAFVHHSAVQGEGSRALVEGQTVTYEEVEGPKGLLAVNVVAIVLDAGARRR